MRDGGIKRLKRVMVGISGGVDSAVAAFLLQKQGFEVAGATFRLWDGASEKDLSDAAIICDKLKIPHYIFDFRERFRQSVMDSFAGDYEKGITPNPGIVCNREIKFGVFLQKALEMGYDYISTGHYAYVEYDGGSDRYRVRKADFDEKDQSYVLYSLKQEQLKAVLLPLGGYGKEQIRKIATENELVSGKKPESQDICFIPDGNYAAFLREYLGKDSEPGDFVDIEGRILGRHKGVRYYTIGQRRGLGLSLEEPMYVCAIDEVSRAVTLSKNGALMKSRLFAEKVNWIDFVEPGAPLRLKAKIRYGAKLSDARITPFADDTAKVVFDEPQRAITKGQSVVFYNGEYVAGGGVICSSE